MRIALDYREAAARLRAGKGEYVYQLVRHLIKILPPNVELILIISRGQMVDLPSGNYHTVVVPAQGAVWHLLVWLWLMIMRPADLYWATNSVIIPSFLMGVRSVITLFDFTPWRLPATHNAHANRIEKIFMPLAAKRAQHFLAISQFTKQEAIELFNIQDEKITVTLLGIDPGQMSARALTPQQVSALRQKYGLPQNFVLYLGTIEPRKNITLAIQAFEEFVKTHPGYHLVLAGGKGWYAEEILASPNPHLVITGYVDDQDRAPLYSLASAFVFPSLYEGFGIPPLEAMACGVPTIISDRASLPEVGGDVAWQVDAADVDALIRTLSQVMGLSSQDKLRWQKRAVSWARQFTWEQTAQITLKVLLNEGR